MTYKNAAAAACEFSLAWYKLVWLCLFADGNHVVGADLDNIKALGRHRGGVRVLGKATNGTLEKVKDTSPVLASFTSSRDPDVVYHITRSGGQLACSCAGFKFRGRCKHIDLYEGVSDVRVHHGQTT